MEPDFIVTWTGEQLRRMAVGVDLDTLRTVYGRNDATARLFFLEEFGSLFDAAPDLFEVWERRLLEPEDAVEKLVSAVVYLHAGHPERAEVLALQAGQVQGGRDIVPFLIAQQAAAEARQWRLVDPYDRRGLEILAGWLDPAAREELVADVVEHAPLGHLGHAAVATIVRLYGVGEEHVALAWRKIDARPFPDPRLESLVLNGFLWCFHRAGQYDLARQVLQRLDGRVSASVWGSAAEFDRARAAILAAGG